MQFLLFCHCLCIFINPTIQLNIKYDGLNLLFIEIVILKCAWNINNFFDPVIIYWCHARFQIIQFIEPHLEEGNPLVLFMRLRLIVCITHFVQLISVNSIELLIAISL